MFERRVEMDPVVGEWYHIADTDEEFTVVAVDEESGTVEVQFFDGDVGEYSPEEWANLTLARIDAPEDWTGAMEPVDDSEESEPGRGFHPREEFSEEDVQLLEDELAAGAQPPEDQEP